MIELVIRAEGGNVVSSLKKEGLVKQELGAFWHELEKRKHELLEVEFDYDFEANGKSPP